MSGRVLVARFLLASNVAAAESPAARITIHQSMRSSLLPRGFVASQARQAGQTHAPSAVRLTVVSPLPAAPPERSEATTYKLFANPLV